MDGPLDELYLRWLYRQTGSIRTRIKARTYWGLLRQLYSTEFVWFVPNDDNRVMDGLELRREFLAESHAEASPEWAELGCSFLEMLIALSRRLSFEAGGEARDWFWQMMENADLDQYNDSAKIPGGDISEKVDRIIWRQYDYNGNGGLFPLKSAEKDQREVELWYQLNAYLIEND